MLPDLTSLELFLRASELGSLSKAASQLHMTLSAASRRLALLEQRMDVQLLRRTSTGVVVTPAGLALVFHAKQLLAQVEQLHVDIADYADGSKGVVRMCAATSALSGFLPQDLAEFAASNPRLKVELLERRSSDGIAAVRDGRTDIAVVLASDPLLTDLRFDRYRTEDLVAVLPQGHALRGRKIAFHRLLDYDIVGLEGSTPLMTLLQDAARAAGQTLRLRAQVLSFDVLCRLIKANMGVGVLPRQAAKTYSKDLGLRLIPLSDGWAWRDSYLCVRSSTLSAPAQRMIEHLLERARLASD
jgi:DNA-binding transcriptional LysR family regulator